jgi:hypothetical protein
MRSSADITMFFAPASSLSAERSVLTLATAADKHSSALPEVAAKNRLTVWIANTINETPAFVGRDRFR